MWGYRTCRVAGVRALRALVRPSHPHVGLLFRVWATPPMYGTGVPRAGQAARVRKKGYSPTPGSPQCAQARYVEPGPSHPHVGLLFRVWATPPMYGTGGPRAEQAARVRDTLESKSLLHAANPHLRLLPMGSCTPSVGIATLLIGCSAL